MAKITPIDPTTLPTRHAGTVYATQGNIYTQRSRPMPVVPRTFMQATAGLGLAQTANIWENMTSAEQLAWEPSHTDFTSAYANFVNYNLPLLLWGLDPFIGLPVSIPTIGGTLYFITSEPDQIHTTLTCYGADLSGLGLESWMRLYLNPSWVSKEPPTVNNGNIFVGSFGPNPPQTPTTYDITGIITALTGQWQYPNYYDPTYDRYCGAAIYGQTIDTDQYGRNGIGLPAPNQQPTYYLGFEGGGIVPGACAAYPTSRSEKAVALPRLRQGPPAPSNAAWVPLSAANRLVLARLRR